VSDSLDVKAMIVDDDYDGPLVPAPYT